MHKLNVGFFDYIHSYPLTGAFRLQKIVSNVTITYSTPSKLNNLLKEKALDASFMSLSAFLEGGYMAVSNFGIASHKQILSVNLYLKKDIKALDNAPVGLTPESCTAVSLLKILCHHFWHIFPRFEVLRKKSSLGSYEGVLLIGDESLKRLQLSGFTTHDLAALWHKETKLPFVFGIFARQNTLSIHKQKELDSFVDILNQSHAWGKKHDDEIITLAIKKSSLPKELIKRYYQLCQYKLNDTHQEAINLFKTLSDAKNLLCPVS